MKLSHTLGIILLLTYSAQAQLPVLSGLTYTDRAPDKLLASRVAVIHTSDFTDDELAEIQKWFQQAGIDAVAYFNEGYIFAGPDFTKYFSDYCTSRVIPFILFLQKSKDGFEFIFTKASGKKNLVDYNEPAWRMTGTNLIPTLRDIYQLALGSQKKQNFLINDIPERDVLLRNFGNKRNESFATEIRSAKIAIPRWGNAADDEYLETYLKNTLRLKIEFVDPSIEEKDLKQSGFTIMLRYVRTRGGFAKELLGYDLSQVSNALNSVTYVQGLQQIKTLPSDQVVYKFYFKNLDSNQVYFGNQWDADLTWQDALRNHVEAMIATLRLN